MAKYVDGFVMVVSDDKADKYKQDASMIRDLWMKNGALAYYECRGDDLAEREMAGEKMRTFPEVAGAKEGETVWMAFVIYKSKKHRDEVNSKAIEEMTRQMKEYENQPLSFDMKRMAFGGFTVEVEG